MSQDRTDRSRRFALKALGGGYPLLVAALNKFTTPENLRKICGENRLRVLDKAKAG
jgi:hypothetical protein